MLLPFRHSSIRVRLLLASTVVQVVLLSLLLAGGIWLAALYTHFIQP